MPLRVLWVIKGLGPGGAEHLLVAAARAHDPAVITLECAYVLPWKDHLAEQLAQAGVQVHCLSRERDDRRWPLRLRQLIRDGGYDVVHVHSPLPGSAARLAVRAMRKSRRPPVVSTEHNLWRTHHRLTRYANRLTGRRDAAIITVTEEVRLSMRGVMVDKAEPLIHGIDVAAVGAHRADRATSRAELGIGVDELVIGTVANFRPQKDYPNLLGALRILVNRGVAVRLVAVGQGPQEARIRALAEELKVADRVIFTGFRADATRVMAAADVFTLASKWEGLPVALMEALALGLPVVATDVGGVGETLRHDVDALLVKPNDTHALADALQRVLGDPALRTRLAAASLKRAAAFDVARAVRRIEEIYAQVAPLSAEHEAGVAVEVVAPAPAPSTRRRLPQGLQIREATPHDRPAILELCRRTLGWGDDPRFEQLYAWKHDQNAFGPSPTWVATDGDRIVGLRAFMRWEFVRGRAVLRAVRAVDTATHPDYQGKGLFTALTLHGLDELQAEGVDFVFNTPNDKSRPGYLKMGWQVVGKLPTAVRFAGPTSAVRVVRSRVASDHWSLPLEIGEPVDEWMDRTAFEPVVAHHPAAVRDVVTNVSSEFLRWRYGLPLLSYRAVPVGDGAVIVRARRRGKAQELVMLGRLNVTERKADRAMAGVLQSTECDHCIRLGGADVRAGFMKLPGGGPVLTWRSLNQESMPPQANWRLGMGDVELF